MGVEVVRKLPLPAPTESSAVQTSTGSITEAATDLSTRTDKTSVTLPEDGTSIAIATRKRREKRSRDHDSTVTRASNQSHTSFLIEFFEGGKGPTRSRPSFRVKVTPPAARKAKDSSDHLQITAGSSRKPSYTKRISLPPAETSDARSSISSYTSAADDSSLGGRDQPLEIEIMHHDQGSDLSARSASRHRHMDLGSEVSSIPPDSMLDGTQGSVTPVRERSRSFSKDAAATSNMLKTPSRRDRSLSKERLAQQVVEKLEGKSKDSSSGRRRHRSKQRSPSVSSEQSSVISHMHKPSRHQEEDDLVSNVESSVVTNSQLSPRRTSGDQYSFRSGTSKSSINNPKLIETVEEAIRRLILPELNTLKHEQKMQQNRQEFGSNNRESPSGSTSVGTSGLFRRVSKHASAPDVTKPKVFLNREENNSGQILSGDSNKGRKYEQDVESPPDRFQREMSAETVIHSEDPRKNTRDGHWYKEYKDAVAVGLASPLLEHHDSRSSVDKRERRRRRSKSHSRSASLAESSEDIFSKHDIPPMPMRSDIYGSEVTRDSLLSERTDDPASPSERRRAEIRQVSRGSGREVISPGSRTPTRTPINLRKGLGTHHSNRSRGDLSIHSVHSGGSLRDEKRLSMAAEVFDTQSGADVAAADRLSEQDHDLNDHDEHTYAHRARNRGLSPIQSVASFKEENEAPNRNSLRQTHSSGSISSMDQRHGKASGMSINSLSSAASTKIARQSRPKGINLENEKDVLEQHDLLHDGIADTEDWYERQHQQNDLYRHQSFGSSNFRDSTEIQGIDDLNTPLHDKVTGTPTTQGMGGNVQYIHVPHGVESAVASLMDPSILSERSKVENNPLCDYTEDHGEELNEDNEETLRNLEGTEDAHQLHHTQSVKDLHDNTQHSGASSPRQSETRSLDHDEEHIALGATGVPVADDPMPEIGHIPNGSESDLVTNPPEINGPIGGLNESRDHWHYQPTPPQSKHDFVSHSNEHSTNASLKAAANGMLSVAALAQQEKEYQKTGNQSRELLLNDDHSAVNGHSPINHDFGPIHDTYMSNQPLTKDEGYGSAPPGMSPEPRQKNAALYIRKGLTNIDDLMADDDPFVNNPRHVSGNSHGMPSPLYDSATGGGIDRIQSKDIVALMDHLTVRDAQRNARDTEILVTLVRSAAEMRNSFEDMKKFIAEQDEMLVETGNKQHDRTTQRIIGGPRPQPAGASRARRVIADDDYDDLPAKRRSVFKRALKGFSGRNSNDYGKIEEMFLQLLGEIEGLKAVQDVRPSAYGTRPGSLSSYDQLRAAGPDGYEPEGQTGTSSTGNHSGYFSNPPSQQPSGMRNVEVRRGSQNRISPVLEGDEEDSNREPSPADQQFDHNNNNLLTPTRDFARGGSVPLDTPPQVHIPTGALSNENTPKTGTDRSRKHKSSSSSFIPKISRWSKTTASSVAENFNKGTSRGLDRPRSDASRSGSDGQQYNANDTYDPHGDDRLRSNESFARAEDRENRPSSPLIPSQVSERPKYQAQRDSLNLQHPQPRIGPTQRYHTHLESQAHTFGSPISPTSDQWGSNPSLARFAPGPGNRHSGGAGNLSPISDAGYSELSVADQVAGSPRASPRPKPRDDGPLIPSTSRSSVKSNRPKFASPLSSEHLAPEQRYSNASGYEQGNGSPRSASNLVPQRKPTGPRPITSSGNFSPDKGLSGIKQNRYRGSPNRIGSPLEQQYTF